jgi:tetratricopeptide (TPR) repeat protein
VAHGANRAASGEAAPPPIAPATTIAAPAAPVPSESLENKVAQLRDAGNWNVMVLMASEWTRKEPANVNAWVELSVAYSMLRQFGDALETATKATRLEPGDPRAWRNLGQVNSALGLPAEALHAFEQAIALDDRDVQSLVQAGLLNAQLARLPQARAAFDKALVASPDDAGALCGLAAIARQQGRPKDAEAIAGRLQTLGRSCRDGSENGTVALVAVHAPAQKSASSRTP